MAVARVELLPPSIAMIPPHPQYLARLTARVPGGMQGVFGGRCGDGGRADSEERCIAYVHWLLAFGADLAQARRSADVADAKKNHRLADFLRHWRPEEAAAFWATYRFGRYAKGTGEVGMLHLTSDTAHLICDFFAPHPLGPWPRRDIAIP